MISSEDPTFSRNSSVLADSFHAWGTNDESIVADENRITDSSKGMPLPVFQVTINRKKFTGIFDHSKQIIKKNFERHPHSQMTKEILLLFGLDLCK
jgi:hypothetical protein